MLPSQLVCNLNTSPSFPPFSGWHYVHLHTIPLDVTPRTVSNVLVHGVIFTGENGFQPEAPHNWRRVMTGDERRKRSLQGSVLSEDGAAIYKTAYEAEGNEQAVLENRTRVEDVY